MDRQAERFKLWLRTYTITPVGVLVLVVLAAAALLSVFGPTSTQAPALAVGIIILAAIVTGGGVSARRGVSERKSLEQRRAEFRPRTRGSHGDEEDPLAEAELWRKERERRQMDENA
jgi:ABC-type transport system involved in cytochrome bd biosynthesis fused ATPase/permease subunit